MRFNLRKYRFILLTLGVFRIPMVWFCRPKIRVLNPERMELLIKLRRRTKNHLGSMYFGALAVGADLAAGFLCYALGREMDEDVQLVFKSTEAKFLKRAETDVVFKCDEGSAIRELVQKCKQTGERQNYMATVNCYNTTDEQVAMFKMEISIKVASLNGL